MKIWNFISALGIDFSVDDITGKKRKILFNRIVFILTLINVIVLLLQCSLIFYNFLYYYLMGRADIIDYRKLYPEEFLYEIVSSIFYLGILYNNQRKKFDLSLKLYLFFFPVYIFIVALSFGPKIDAHFIFLICYLQIFMFCGLHQKKLIIYSLIFTTILLLLTIIGYNYFDYSFMNYLPERNYINIVTNILISVLLIYEFYKITENTEIALNHERKKSDNLLANILPESAIIELKDSGAVKPVFYPSATILFTDFKGFTKIAEKLTPKELITELDFCFSQFDKIIKKNNLEKLKTIGDSYMCAGGIPKENKSHPIDCILAALEIQTLMEGIKKNKLALGFDYWELRIGIHTGPLIAGVIGVEKFAYDVWGDTVNIASRMESSGEVGKINISEKTYNLIKDYFECEYRGEIDAKNKGKIDMYFLLKLKEEFSKDETGKNPNNRFIEEYEKIKKHH